MPSAPRPQPFHPARPHVLRPMRTDPTGRRGPTPNQAPGRAWRQTTRGRFLPADLPVSVEQRIADASMALPAYGGVTGWAALRWMGAGHFDGAAPDGSARPVVLAVLHRAVREQRGLEVSSERLAPETLTVVDGLRVTTAVRSVCFEMRYAAGVRAATIALDMAAAADLVSIAEVQAYADTCNGWTGIPQARAAIGLASENSWSPMEVEMRLVWELDAGVPTPAMNQPVFDRSGRHLGTPDLLDVEAGVVGEYDGALHLERRRRTRDITREHAFRAVGLEYFTMTAADRIDPLRTIVPRMLHTRARATFERAEERAWTVDPPPWWTPTTTVERRRRLSDDDRRRLLRPQAG
ncbi:hypothetical protein QWY28_16105 [Nocardioides sp. SOB77]|uniref:AbiEi antitoxin C-terminal domain-containing protein n=1 Tax=Nocardioides oceani TaxID=3058369 RepID=A0ABT8FIG8_9ACTN|nr:hypothetical protein [Nocardioides oceani]MDN4174484.1 hypothetical protein [Nocardioides oceani]